MSDKAKHLLVCLAATLAVGLCLSFLGTVTSVLSGSLFSFGLGLGKEYGDSKSSSNHWDWRDILYDLLGIVIADCALLLIRAVSGSI